MSCNDQYPHADEDELWVDGVEAGDSWMNREIEAAGAAAHRDDTLPDETHDESVSGGDEGVRAEWSDHDAADGEEGGCNSASARVNGSVPGSECGDGSEDESVVADDSGGMPGGSARGYADEPASQHQLTPAASQSQLTPAASQHQLRPPVLGMSRQAKISKNEVIDIFLQKRPEGMSLYDFRMSVADKFGVGHETVKNIWKGTTYRRYTDELRRHVQEPDADRTHKLKRSEVDEIRNRTMIKGQAFVFHCKNIAAEFRTSGKAIARILGNKTYKPKAPESGPHTLDQVPTIPVAQERIPKVSVPLLDPRRFLDAADARFIYSEKVKLLAEKLCHAQYEQKSLTTRYNLRSQYKVEFKVISDIWRGERQANDTKHMWEDGMEELVKKRMKIKNGKRLRGKKRPPPPEEGSSASQKKPKL